ncbi:diphosphomevalonate decarboxylase isoform X3 [Sceloporus undulatus]|uniref:diphosphomevalonate decarboxylase isoform X3 n=1 Tax=Sceloporus undulatus TaxID=8520 RepID=UPI001C4BACDF|nr:diphosphomevalonate decarboxylase isoform X3 [Sceloporus undulatus]
MHMWEVGLQSWVVLCIGFPCSQQLCKAMAEDHPQTMVTCTAPVNIAVVKYWGKRDEQLILPINSSLSVTLHQDQLKTTTTAAISRDFTEDRLWLNGKEEDIGHPRLQSCLREIYTLAKLYGIEGDLSEVARMGSGSACRSMFGGFVQWVMGEDADGKDSVAQQVAQETHWPELRILILVVSAEKKPMGSTAGMQTSVKTSFLLKHRAQAVVPERMAQMIRHIQQRDFEAFGELTMKESNQFHATCLDTFPPIFYLNDISKQVVALVHRFNTHCGKTKVAYTFDAGPNAVLFMLEETVGKFVEVVKRSFPPENNGGQFLKGLPVEAATPSEELLSAVVRDPSPGAVRYLLLTKPGPGPALMENADCHLLGADGLLRSSSS